MFSVLTSAIESVAGIDSKTAFTFCERCASFDDFPHLVHLCVLEALGWCCSSIIVMVRSMLFMRANCALLVSRCALAAYSILFLTYSM